jgi:hypothetical protein
MARKVRRFFVEVKSYGCERDLDDLRKDTGSLSRSLAAAGFLPLAVYEPERVEIREVIERTYEPNA